jgi:protein tyrosine/serine phosphatase
MIVAGAAGQGCGGVPQKADPNDPAGNFYEVSPGVWRGGRPDEVGVQRLQQLGFKTDIDLENEKNVVAQEKAWAEANGLDFVEAPMTGTSEPDDEQTNAVLAILADESRKPAYVHCMKGQDRTGLIIALHRVFNEGWKPEDAYNEMMAHGYNWILGDMKEYFEKKTGWED